MYFLTVKDGIQVGPPDLESTGWGQLVGVKDMA